MLEFGGGAGTLRFHFGALGHPSPLWTSHHPDEPRMTSDVLHLALGRFNPVAHHANADTSGQRLDALLADWLAAAEALRTDAADESGTRKKFRLCNRPHPLDGAGPEQLGERRAESYGTGLGLHVPQSCCPCRPRARLRRRSGHAAAPRPPGSMVVRTRKRPARDEAGF